MLVTKQRPKQAQQLGLDKHLLSALHYNYIDSPDWLYEYTSEYAGIEDKLADAWESFYACGK